MTPPRDNGTQTCTDQESYFLPDLCKPLPTLFLILSVELLVFVYALAVSELPRFQWELFSQTSYFMQWIALSSAWMLCKSRRRFSELSLPLATIASLGLVSLATYLSSIFVQVYLAEIIGLATGRWWLLRNLLIANILAGMLLRYFYVQQQLRLRDKWALQARLDSLRARMRPHFLFNTLNSIASLVDSRPQAAEQAVEDLAALLRISLQENHGETTVEDEVELTERYLGIEALRLGERLSVEWDVDESIRNTPMPSLVLQPLAENAIYHGIARIPGGGCISIRIWRGPRFLHASVTNPVPTDASEYEGHQLALANIEQRLQATYGMKSSLITRLENQTFYVELSYPPLESVNNFTL